MALCLPAHAQLQFFGYTGVDQPGALEAVEALGIDTNLGSLIYSESNWQTLDTEAVLARFEAGGSRRPVRAGVSVAGFLFEAVPVAGSPCDWMDVDGDGMRDEFGTFLREDWAERLLAWWKIHGPELRPERLAFVVVHEEVNNHCVDLDQVALLAGQLRELFPTTPLAMGWGRTHVPGRPGAKPAPAFIPEELDWLGIWSYGIYDPTDPTNPKNANSDFFDPTDPENPATDYGDLLSRKWPHQKVVVIFDAHFQNRPDGVHQLLGWSSDDLADLVFNYWAFARARPEVVALYGFHWSGVPGSFLGLEDLVAASPAVLAAHQLVGCQIAGFCR